MSAETKYFGRWSSWAEFKENWSDYHYGSDGAPGGYVAPDGIATDDEIIFASYGGGSYEGDAVVLFRRDGKLYEVHGSHCSCNGLEGQWSPEEATWEALATRQRPAPDKYYHALSDHETEAIEMFWRLVDAAVGTASAGQAPEYAKARGGFLTVAQREALLFLAIDGGPATVEQIRGHIERPITEETLVRLEREGLAFRTLGNKGWQTTGRGDRRAELYWNKCVRRERESAALTLLRNNHLNRNA